MPVEVEKAYNAIITEATKEGLEKGRAEGLEKGKAEGRAEGQELAFINLFKQNLISLETVINNLKISKEEFLSKVANS